jgi:hypothetical protein
LTIVMNADFHEGLCVANCGVSRCSEANDMVRAQFTARGCTPVTRLLRSGRIL